MCWELANLPSRPIRNRQKDWKVVRAVRDEVLKALEEARNQKLIGGGLEAQVTLTAVGPRVLCAGAL